MLGERGAPGEAGKVELGKNAGGEAKEAAPEGAGGTPGTGAGAGGKKKKSKSGK